MKHTIKEEHGRKHPPWTHMQAAWLVALSLHESNSLLIGT